MLLEEHPSYFPVASDVEARYSLGNSTTGTTPHKSDGLERNANGDVLRCRSDTSRAGFVAATLRAHRRRRKGKA